MTAFYDSNSNLVGTTQPESFKDLPDRGQKEIKKHYKNYTVSQVIFFKDNEMVDTNMVLYDTPFEDADNYFAELTKGNDKIVVEISPEGNVSYFKKI